MELFFYHFNKTHHISYCPSDSRDTGGLVSLLAKKDFPSSTVFSSFPIIPGRALRTLIMFDDRQQIHYNIHNHNISSTELATLFNHINNDINLTNLQPLNVSIILAGDFNFLSPGDFPLPLSRSTAPSDFPSNASPHTKWNLLLAPFTEIQPLEHSHFNASSDSLSRLDRIYVLAPPWVFTKLKCAGTILSDPILLHSQKISDHAPVCIRISSPSPMPKLQQPLPAFLFKTPEYRLIHDQLLSASSLDSLPTLLRWQTHKDIMREAATQARDVLLLQATLSPPAASMLFSTMSRLVWYNKVSLAYKLILKSTTVATYIHVVNGKVTFINSDDFSNAFSAAKLSLAASNISDLHSSSLSSPKLNDKKVRKIQLHAKLWKSSHRKLVLQAILLPLPNGSLTAPPPISSPADMALHLASHWSPVFTKSDSSPEHSSAMSSLLSEFSGPWDCTAIRPPTADSFVTTASRAKPSATGPDGIPYAAWANSGPAAGVTLQNLYFELAADRHPSLGFNDSVTVFIPKGEADNDLDLLARHPGETRPLGLKNSDNKTIASNINYSLKPIIFNNACKLQRGFIAGRNFLNNIVDLDSFARLFSDPSSKCSLPILCFFDFAAAFPSILHDYLMAIISKIGLPTGQRNAIHSFYRLCVSFLMSGNQLVFFTFLFSGVIQGCPLSGSLFAIAMDPILRLMQQKIEARALGHVRACADDIGIVLRSIASLSELAPIFGLALHATGLDLKPSKCNIVPLDLMSDSVKQQIMQWLIDHLPHWQTFKVTNCAKYLGFFLGPGASFHSYRAPFFKWAGRAKEISAANLGPAASAFAYNTEAASTLSYIGQLLLFPFSLYKQQDAHMSSLLNIPHKGMGSALPFHLKTLTGGLSFTCIRTYNFAALSRAALVTVVTWRSHYESLVNHTHSSSLAQFMSGRLCPLHWLTDPIAVTLHKASTFFQDIMKWNDSTLSSLYKAACSSKPQAGIYKALLPQIQLDTTSRDLETRALRIFGDPPPLPHPLQLAQFPCETYLHPPSPPHQDSCAQNCP